MAEHNDLGKWGEDEAALYLEDEGYTIIDRDWRLGRRDLDILAYTPDGNTLVVVEVKTRSGDDYQRPEEAVDGRKMRNLAALQRVWESRRSVMRHLMWAIRACQR